MSTLARYGKSVAKQGQGEALAGHLLAAAGGLASDPGCLLYLVNRQKDAPDTVWVTEIWRSQADLDAALARIRDSEQAAAVRALAEDWQMIELEPLGGKGPAPDHGGQNPSVSVIWLPLGA